MRMIAAVGALALAGCNQVFGLDPIADPDLLPSAPIAIAAGGAHTCALFADRIRCWGRGLEGQLGVGVPRSFGDDESIATAPDVDLRAVAVGIAIGARHSCARRATGEVQCWGDARLGRLGHGDEENVGDDEPVWTAGAIPLAEPVKDICAGAAHTCAVTSGGSVICWGAGGDGRLGRGSTISIGDDEPLGIGGAVALTPTIVQVACGESHTCARSDTGNVYCWGRGAQGQLGYGSNVNLGDGLMPVPSDPVGLAGPVRQLVAGANHTCALQVDGFTFCWGDNSESQLGLGLEPAAQPAVGDDEQPDTFGPLLFPAVQLAAGGAHTCALNADGEVACWGANDLGQLGYGNTVSMPSEQPGHRGMVPLGERAVEITAGAAHTCARLVSGRVVCWGDGSDGRLGYGDTANVGDTPTTTPAMVGPIPL